MNGTGSNKKNENFGQYRKSGKFVQSEQKSEEAQKTPTVFKEESPSSSAIPIIFKNKNLDNFKGIFVIPNLNSENKTVDKPLEFHSIAKGSKLLLTKMTEKSKNQSDINQTASQIFGPVHLISKSFLIMNFVFY